MRTILISLLKFYKAVISPWLPPSCRFQPTCSEYAQEAIQKYGAIKGIGMAVWRLLRCQAFCAVLDNEVTTTIPACFGRFGGRAYSLELSFSASEAAAAAECERKRIVVGVTFAVINCASREGDRDTNSRASCRVSDARS